MDSSFPRLQTAKVDRSPLKLALRGRQHGLPVLLGVDALVLARGKKKNGSAKKAQMPSGFPREKQGDASDLFVAG